MTKRPLSLPLPTCPACGQAAGWTGTFRFQTERIWEVRPDEPNPWLVYEDDDCGEWGDIHCSGCHAAAADLESPVIDALIGG